MNKWLENQKEKDKQEKETVKGIGKNLIPSPVCRDLFPIRVLLQLLPMDPTKQEEIAQDFSPMLRVYKNGRVERLMGTATLPPSLDPTTNVQSKDVIYSPQTNQHARLFLPKSTHPNQKLPLLVYFHGGGFAIETAFSPTYHNHLNTLVAEANIIAVSVDYRRAPEHPLPAAHDDSWAALEWVASHSDGTGPEDWLNRHADIQNVFFAGDSAGANIAHHMAMRVGEKALPAVNLNGVVLVHPYFWGKEPVGDEVKDMSFRSKVDAMWLLAFPDSSGSDDPLLNVCGSSGPSLAGLGCRRVLVCVAGKDFLRARGWEYYEKLLASGWEGVVEIAEDEEENHVFHLLDPTKDSSKAAVKRIAAFIRHDRTI
ncbi:probable carboxylesterase 12 [Carica papaya]|uniref:probable carboxylesterase 12 n=1 Tax=Carica papaya TaxID=3649 RepID=UPI000B8D1404|nr:probable carboxylesterase 12 [Carica papaya]